MQKFRIKCAKLIKMHRKKFNELKSFFVNLKEKIVNFCNEIIKKAKNQPHNETVGAAAPVIKIKIIKKNK